MKNAFAAKSVSCFALVVFAAVVSVAVIARPAQALTGQEIIDKTIAAYNSISSYSYTDFEHGYDTFARKTQAELTEKNASLAQSQGVDAKKPKQDAPPTLKDGTYIVKFLKPFNIQMIMVKSDFVPAFLNEGKFTYNASDNPKVWWARAKSVPTPLKMSVAKDKSGGFLTMGWTFKLLGVKNMASNGTVKLVGNEKALAQDCYVVEISFTKDSWKKFKPITVDYKAWGIPADMKSMVDDTLKDPTVKKYSSTKLWISKKNFVIVKSEDYINGKFFWRTEYRKIELNKLKKSDFNYK
jgi:hypothetical protein